MEDNIMERRSILDLMERKFFIPEYQRGYRWESSQINKLLDDLLAYFDSESEADFYCLQPVVVKECDNETIKDNDLDGEGWFEVIDGQQRLTTIRIICAIYDSMDNKDENHTFILHYATRPKMDGIYKSMKVKYNNETKKYELINKIEKNSNLDSVYIYNAAKTIVEWFNEEDRRKNIFGMFFFNKAKEKKSVQVIWYDDRGTKDARDIFNEINDLTVKLSCSELIRSLFLSSEAHYDDILELDGIDNDTKKKLQKRYKENQQRYVNTKWDEIEHRLSDQQMQSFMSNSKHEELRNNIELLFDLISQKNVGGEKCKADPLYTFIYFNDEIKRTNASQMWQVIEKYYSRLCGWIEDRDLYHKIGYLNGIDKDDTTISELLAYAESHQKSEMMEEIDKRICKSVEEKDATQLSSLDYQKRDDYNYIRKLLFLYNVEMYRRMKTEVFFPFKLFKPLNKWTLEHIHAQNSECLPPDNREVWINWCRENAETLKTLIPKKDLKEKCSVLIKELKNAEKGFKLKNKEYTHIKITELFDKVAEFYDAANTDNDKDIDRPKYVHQLSNMTLLSQKVNSSVGCSAFAVKRLNINMLRNNGVFFPIGTVNVFQKAYSKNQQLYEWSNQDRRAYMASIKWNLRRYLTIN